MNSITKCVFLFCKIDIEDGGIKFKTSSACVRFKYEKKTELMHRRKETPCEISNQTCVYDFIWERTRVKYKVI